MELRYTRLSSLAFIMTFASLLMACGQAEKEDSEKAEPSVELLDRYEKLEGRIKALEEHVADLRNSRNANIPAESAPPVSRPAQKADVRPTAILLGQSASGEPVEREFSSFTACNNAKASLIAEADRICEQRRNPETGPKPVFVDCLKPQLTCSNI